MTDWPPFSTVTMTDHREFGARMRQTEIPNSNGDPAPIPRLARDPQSDRSSHQKWADFLPIRWSAKACNLI
jgi:hypothetical protein